MVELESYCYKCQNPINMKVSQTVVNLCLRWSASGICSFCGAAVELDDTGFPPNGVRQSILSEQGEWYLAIEKLELNKIVAIKILRQALNISIVEVGKLLKNYSNSPIKGTHIEMQWLKQLLAHEGIQAAIVKRK